MDNRATPIHPASAAAHIGEDNPVWRFPGFRVEKSRSWRLVSADVISRTAGDALWRSDRHRIVYALTSVPGTIQSDDRPAETDGLARRKLAFRPGGGTVRSSVQTTVRIIQILQSPDTYNNFICDMVRGGRVPLEPSANVSNPLMSRIVLALANDIEGGLLDHVLADALNTALAVQVIRQFADTSAITLTPSNGLSVERLSRVHEYIEAHLAEPLTLTDIAGVACLSTYHLSRSFRLATGIGLHRYVVLRRLQRAKDLILKTKLPLSEIAWAVGFDSQASFTERFRREVGVTPGRMRAGQA
jgi:AraC family transcriptional regulator